MLACKSLLEQTYVDDILSGADTLKDLNILYSQLKTLLNSSNFPLHKWNSNSQVCLNQLDLSQQAQYISPEGSPNKVLGIIWNPNKDCFSVSIPNITPISSYTSITKREVLSKISMMFDPVGWAGPILVNAKKLMQQV